MFTSSIPLRSGDVLEVVRYDSSTTGIPSMVTAEDVGVSNPLIVSGTVEVEHEYTCKAHAKMKFLKLGLPNSLSVPCCILCFLITVLPHRIQAS